MSIDVTRFDWARAVEEGSIQFKVLGARDQYGEPSEEQILQPIYLYKALSPTPPFDFHEAPSMELVEPSLYRWWFEFLRLSFDYWFVCKLARKGELNDKNVTDGKIVRVYNSFGDVFNQDFESWWRTTGQVIFAEQSALRVREIDLKNPTLAPPISSPVATSSNMVSSFHRILVEIPISLPKSEIVNQIAEILRKAEYAACRPSSRFGTSSAMFPAKGNFQTQSFISPYLVCALDIEAEATNRTMLDKIVASAITQTDYATMESASTTMSNLRNKGKRLISGAEGGEFPLLDDGSNRIRARKRRKFSDQMESEQAECRKEFLKHVIPFEGSAWQKVRIALESVLECELRTRRPRGLDAFGRRVRHGSY